MQTGQGYSLDGRIQRHLNREANVSRAISYHQWRKIDTKKDLEPVRVVGLKALHGLHGEKFLAWVRGTTRQPIDSQDKPQRSVAC
jgi:hypothetical protein